MGKTYTVFEILDYSFSYTVFEILDHRFFIDDENIKLTDGLKRFLTGFALANVTRTRHYYVRNTNNKHSIEVDGIHCYLLAGGKNE